MFGKTTIEVRAWMSNYIKPFIVYVINHPGHKFNAGLAILPWQQGSLGQHGAHLGPTGPRWVPCWPHEPSYLGLWNSPWWPFNIEMPFYGVGIPIIKVKRWSLGHLIFKAEIRYLKKRPLYWIWSQTFLYQWILLNLSSVISVSFNSSNKCYCIMSWLLIFLWWHKRLFCLGWKKAGFCEVPLMWYVCFPCDHKRYEWSIRHDAIAIVKHWWLRIRYSAVIFVQM